MSVLDLARPESRAAADDVQRPTPGTRVPRWLLIAIVAVGAALRIRWSTVFGLSFDEAFTGMAGRKSLTGMFDFLAHQDSHPPLDYVLRMPLARLGVGDLAFRAPSLVFSVAALALFAWWMRDRGWAGATATALLAVSGFQISYGSEARMYALLELLGVAAAVVAERWVVSPQRWHAWAIAGIVFVGLLDHVSMSLLAIGLVLLAGIRTDRVAWRWRAGVVVGGIAWAAVWGASFLTQARVHHPSWIPITTLDAVGDVVAGHVSYTDGVKYLVLLAVAAGAVFLFRRERPLFSVWLACGILPIALAAAVGAVTPFFLDRTVTAEAWAPVLAVAFVVDTAARRWRVLGVVAAVTAVVVCVSGTAVLLGSSWFYDLTVQRLRADAVAGDVIAVAPTWYSPLTDWRLDVRTELGPVQPVDVDLADAAGYRLTGAPSSGRIWLVEYGTARPPLTAYEECAEPWRHGETVIRCLEPRAVDRK